MSRYGNDQVIFPAVVVAVNTVTGTQYGRVRDDDPNSPTIKVATRNSYKDRLRENIRILRPELVRHAPGEIRDYRRVKVSHVPREKLDMLVKAHVPAKAFLDYDGFLNEIMELFNA